MAWRIHEQVKRAVFDNRIRGMITGLVWLEGRSDPLRLELWGNAWSDLAGRLIQIENLAFRSGPIEGLATEQRGVCGDLTAVRRGRMPVVQSGTGSRLQSQLQGSMPQIWSTGIYAEWFSERNGRVVTDLLGCCTCVSERVWQPTLDEQLEPAWCNLEAVDAFLRSRASA